MLQCHAAGYKRVYRALALTDLGTIRANIRDTNAFLVWSMNTEYGGGCTEYGVPHTTKEEFNPPRNVAASAEQRDTGAGEKGSDYFVQPPSSTDLYLLLICKIPRGELMKDVVGSIAEIRFASVAIIRYPHLSSRVLSDLCIETDRMLQKERIRW